MLESATGIKWENSVTIVQESVISCLTSNKVHNICKFKYLFAFSAEVTLDGLNELVENSEVVLIEKNELNQLHLAQGIPLMSASLVRNQYNGEGVAIAICDTGIDSTHPMLGNGGFPNSKVIGGYDIGENDPDPMSPMSPNFSNAAHGTGCAGIAAGDLGMTGDYISGVAYNAKLYALKVCDDNGAMLDDAIIAAWEWCITHQYDNLSYPIMIISTTAGQIASTG